MSSSACFAICRASRWSAGPRRWRGVSLPVSRSPAAGSRPGASGASPVGPALLPRAALQAEEADQDRGEQERHHRDRDRGALAERAAVDRALEWGAVHLWTVDGEAVASAARRAPIRGVARIGPVYTPPALRARGFGAAVTASATAAILDLGTTPVLFTDLDNPVSNAIYQRLGYRPVGDYAQLTVA